MQQLKEKQLESISLLEKKLLGEEFKIKFLDNKKFNTLEELIIYACTMKQYQVPLTKKYGEGKKFKDKQMLGGSRSLQDLFLLSKTYFEECKLIDIINILRTLNSKNKLNAWLCVTYGKYMYRVCSHTYELPNLYNKKYGI